MLYRKHMLALVSRALKVYKQHVPRIIQLLRFESYFHWFFFETDPFCIYMSMIEWYMWIVTYLRFIGCVTW